MKVVVTGATGHVGGYVVAKLAADGHEVVAVSRSGALPALPFGVSKPVAAVRAVAADIARDDATAIVQRELGPEVALVHLAAFHPPSTWSSDSDERRTLTEINVRGAMRVLEAARQKAGGAKCVVYASSFEVYGEVAGSAPISEAARLSPRTAYGATKLSGEDHLISFAYEERTRVVALRMPAIYGPGEHTPRALPNFLLSVLRGQRPTVFGDGSDLRDQLHARDAANAVALSITSGASGIFNVADGEPHSILQLARLALEVSGMGGEPELRERAKARVDCHMSIAAARTQLGFTPAVTLRDGMAEQLAWLRATPST